MDAPAAQYVTTEDGYDIAYGVLGKGTPVLFPPFIHSHLQLDWTNDLIIARRSRILGRLAERFRVITFDNRGQGLSSRGLRDDITLSDFDLDTEAVAATIPETEFIAVACARASHLAVRYAIRYPERVSALVLISAQASMQNMRYGLWDLLPDQNWEFFLQTQLIPGLSPEEIRSATEMLKQTSNPEDYRATWRTWVESDITDLLSELRVPTLILHPRDFPFTKPEQATRLAALIPNARLMMTDGFEIFGEVDQTVTAIESFLAELPSGTQPPTSIATIRQPSHLPEGELPDVGHRDVLSELSPRQAEVLHLISLGMTNREIAEELVLSLRTVERHAEELYSKLGVRNRAEAIALALNSFSDA